MAYTAIIIIILVIVIAVIIAIYNAPCLAKHIQGSAEPAMQRVDIKYVSSREPLKALVSSTGFPNVIIHNPKDSKAVVAKKWNKLSMNGYYAVSEFGKVDSVRDILTYSRNSKYLGSDMYNQKRYYVWQKVPSSYVPASIANEDTWNPPINIEQHSGFNVITDDMLIGGTKQRGSIPLLGQLPEKEFIYVGPYTGFAQVALALAAKLNGKIATLFIQKHRPMLYQTKLAIQLGANIYEFDKKHGTLSAMRKYANEYREKQNKKHATRLFVLGFQEQEFKDALSKSLAKAIKDTPLADPEFNGTIWVTGGSAVLTNVFYKLFPKARINVVQIGKAIDWYVDRERSDFYIAPERFYETAKIVPPYPSVPEYTARIK
jgi:hypothetical protein